MAVFGVGGVGLSAIGAAAIAGADPIIAVDLYDRKLQFAREFGATHGVNASDSDAVSAIWAISRAESTSPSMQSARRQPLSRFWRQPGKEGRGRTTKGAWRCSSGFPPPTSRST